MALPRQPIHIEPTGWGREVWIANTPLYCGKILEIRRGKRCSLHYHTFKTESFFLRTGRLRVRIKRIPGDEIIKEFENGSRAMHGRAARTGAPDGSFGRRRAL